MQPPWSFLMIQLNILGGENCKNMQKDKVEKTKRSKSKSRISIWQYFIYTSQETTDHFTGLITE